MNRRVLLWPKLFDGRISLTGKANDNGGRGYEDRGDGPLAMHGYGWGTGAEANNVGGNLVGGGTGRGPRVGLGGGPRYGGW